MTARDGWKSRMQLNHTFLDAYWQQNDCQGWRFIRKTRWTMWYCSILCEAIDWFWWIYNHKCKKKYIQGWLWMEQPTDHDGYSHKKTQWMIGPWLIIHTENDQSWRMLFKNSKERYELGQLPVKQTINQDWCILIKTFEF